MQSYCWKGKDAASRRPCCNPAGRGSRLPDQILDQILDPEAGHGSRRRSALTLHTAALPTHPPLARRAAVLPLPFSPADEPVCLDTTHINILTFACTHTPTHTCQYSLLSMSAVGTEQDSGPSYVDANQENARG